jgi:hypothetical protein
MILWLKFVKVGEASSAVGDKQRGTMRPDFDRSISVHFQVTHFTIDAGFLFTRKDTEA